MFNSLIRLYPDRLWFDGGTLITVGAVLTWLDRGNHVEHAADSAFERVARVAERIGHEMENMTLDMSGQMQNGQSPIQELVTQESQYGGILRLEVVDGAGVIVGSGDEAALSKILGGSTVAMIQEMLMLAFAPLIGVPLTVGLALQLGSLMFITAFALPSLGVVIAVRMRSLEGFQMIMNFLNVPLLFLSGAFFPLRDLPIWLTVLVRVNPFT